MAYSVKILGFAHILCKNSVLLKGGDDNNTTKIGCFAFLMQNENEYILIDTGIESIDVVNTTKSSNDDWARGESEYDLLTNLKEHSIDPKQISKVLITHSHYDHLSGILHLTNADIYINKMELDFLLSDEHPHKNALTAQIEFIKKKNVIAMNDNHAVNDDIIAIKAGGHTPGSTMFQVNTNIGKIIFAGDDVFLHENIEKNVHIGFSYNETKAKRAVEICRHIEGTVITSHDFKCKEVIKYV